MDLHDLGTHSGWLCATWAIRQRSLARLVGSYCHGIGFDWLHPAALGDQPMQPIRLASSTELIDLGANENPNA